MTLHKDNEPSSKEEVPELCKQTFVSMRSGLVVLWTVAVVLLGCAGTAVGWAMQISTSIAETKVVQSSLQDQINSKLDFLIKNFNR
jgi:predicted RecA/RadA family phage recombinase